MTDLYDPIKLLRRGIPINDRFEIFPQAVQKFCMRYLVNCLYWAKSTLWNIGMDVISIIKGVRNIKVGSEPVRL